MMRSGPGKVYDVVPNTRHDAVYQSPSHDSVSPAPAQAV
jgi:hypothetical protein